MKKKLLILGILLGGFAFGAEAKYNLENIQNQALNGYLQSVAIQGTQQFLLNQFNQSVLSQLEANKNLKADKDAKVLATKAFITVLGELGYDSNIEFRDKDMSKIEIALYTDKTLSQIDTNYIFDLLDKAFKGIYGNDKTGTVNIYSDKKLKTLKK